MDSQRWTRVSELFEQATELAPATRDTWLAQQCAGDDALRAAVQRLLDADSEAGDFLDAPMFENRALDTLGLSEAWDPAPGHDIGPYRLLQLIGRGGMGQVFLAERNDGQFEQRVALKLLLHPGAALLRRFLAERQILARLEHPNIARLLDGGVGKDGVPYFAMEYVDGTQIIAYCEQHALDLRARLQLFVQVCEAVHYAHRNLVVHRDIKPSNILVTTEGQPKLLDFGIAKLLETTASSDGTATQTLSRMLTPDYAAPEQIRGQTITTATDVYSLGVVLYELLTGVQPYTFRNRAVSLEQAILQTEPLAPSAAVVKIAGTTTQRRRQLRGDLDRIVLKALAKEPERRYASAEALGADIRRCLDGRPIIAQGDSALYRLRKFVRRNRIAVAAATLALGALIVATIFSLHQAQLAREQARRAEQKSRTAEAMKDYMLSVFTSADPYAVSDHVVSARELLEGGLHSIGAKLGDQPEVRAELDTAFGNTFMQLGQHALAKEGYQAALADYRKFKEADSEEVLESELSVANVDAAGTPPADLQERLEQIVGATQDKQQRLRQVRWDALEVLGILQQNRGDYPSAGKTEEDLVKFSRDYFGDENEKTAYALFDLVQTRVLEGRFDEAVVNLRELVATTHRIFDPTHPLQQQNAAMVGAVAGLLGDWRGARELMRKTAGVMTLQLDPGSPYLLALRSGICRLDVRLAPSAAARQCVFDTAQQFAAQDKNAGMNLAELQFQSANALLDAEDTEHAESLLSQAEKIVADSHAKHSSIGTQVSASRARLSLVQGDAAKALTTLAPVLDLQRTRNDRELPESLMSFIRAARIQHRDDEADRALAELVDVLARQGRPNHPYAIYAHDEMAKRAEGKNDLALAQSHARLAAVIALRAYGAADARCTVLVDRLQRLQARESHAASSVGELEAQVRALPDPLADLESQASVTLDEAQRNFKTEAKNP